MDPDSADSDAILRIEGDMSIYRANELKAVLLQALQASPQTEVDLSAVTEMDTAGLQLLMMAKRSAQQGQRRLRLVRHSPAVLEVFELLNLAAFFGDPLVMSPRGPSDRA